MAIKKIVSKKPVARVAKKSKLAVHKRILTAEGWHRKVESALKQKAKR